MVFCVGSRPVMNKLRHYKQSAAAPSPSSVIFFTFSQKIYAQLHLVKADSSRIGVNRQWSVKLQEKKLGIIFNLFQVHSGSSADSDSVTSGNK